MGEDQESPQPLHQLGQESSSQRPGVRETNPDISDQSGEMIPQYVTTPCHDWLVEQEQPSHLCILIEIQQAN